VVTDSTTAPLFSVQHCAMKLVGETGLEPVTLGL
jgi:hypothetical protein